MNFIQGHNLIEFVTQGITRYVRPIVGNFKHFYLLLIRCTLVRIGMLENHHIKLNQAELSSFEINFS